MKRITAETLGAVHTHTHTHTGSFRGCLTCNKIIEEYIKTHVLYSFFCVTAKEV